MPSTIIVSYSEIDTARQCLFKQDLSYKQRWTAPTTSPALQKGTLWHSVLEMHYRLIKLSRAQARDGYAWGVDEEAVVLQEIPQRVIQELLLSPIGNQTDIQELVTWMYRGYVEYYGFDDQWTILAVEHAPTCWLPTDRGGRSRFKLKLKIDLVVANKRGEIWIVDHKSGANLANDKELDIDDQFGLYTWAMRKLGRKVAGSLYSGARTQRNKDQVAHFQPLDERFLRKHLYRSDTELDTIAIEAYKTARRAYSIPVGEAERSPNIDTCKWKCDYTEPCLGARKGMDLREFLEAKGFVQDFTRH